MNTLQNKLLEKAKEAFVLAIEIYNKPTIKYRVEGFGFFICNAWELMLKAHIINTEGEAAIYYKDNPTRTISLENCIQKIFTNNKMPLRLNLEKIIELRNTSTHFITEEYEMVYIPLFQSCIFNFTEKMQAFFNIDMTEIIPQNFLTLTVSMAALNETEIRGKYPEIIATKLVNTSNEISAMVSENNHNFAIKIEHNLLLTKNPDKATALIHIENDATTPGVKIIKELKDPNETHKYTAKNCVKEIQKRLEKNHIPLTFNMYHFKLFTKYYNIKDNPKLCYTYKVNAQPTYSYSIQTIDFIVDEIKKDPDNIIQTLKEKTAKK